MKVLTQKNIKTTFFFLTSFFVLMLNLVNRFLFLDMKILLIKLLKQFLKTLNTVKKY